jgi:hypothetical protein
MLYVTLLFTVAVAGATEGSATGADVGVGDGVGVAFGVGVGVGVGVGGGVGVCTVTWGAATDVINVALTCFTELLVFSVVMASLTALANAVGVKAWALWLATVAAAVSVMVAVNVTVELVRRAAAAVELTVVPVLISVPVV